MMRQDGYTLETLDIYTIEDSVEKVVIHDVRLLPLLMFAVCHDALMTDPHQAYVCSHFHWRRRAT